MNFINDLRDFLVDFYSKNGFSFDSTNSTHELLCNYFNVKSKLIPPIPRTVFISSEISRKMNQCPYRKGLAIVQHRLEHGENVNCFLSKSIFSADYNDLLLHDWGIYHLHLSDTKRRQGDYFYRRSDWLLFARVEQNAAYLLEVYHHKEAAVFARKELLHVMQRNWPDVIESYRIKGVAGANPDLTNEQISCLRKQGGNALIEINRRVYAPIGGGYMTNGTNIQHLRSADYLFYYINNVQKGFEDNIESIKREITSQTGIAEKDIWIRLKVTNQGIVIEEAITGCTLYEFNMDSTE